MITLLLVFGLVAVAVYTYRNYTKQYDDIGKLPGPSTYELVKELYFNKKSKGIISYFQSLPSKYGPVVKIWLKPFKPMIITKDMEYLAKIFKNNEFHITPTLFEMTIMGEGIASNADYDTWKKDKHIVIKSLTKHYIGSKLGIYDIKYNELMDEIRSNLGKPIDIEKHLHRILLEVLLETFNHEGIHIDKKEIRNYCASRNEFFVFLMEKMNSLKCAGFLHKLTDNYKEIWKRHHEVVDFAYRWLEQFKKLDEPLRDQTNLIYAMMEGGIPDKRIVDNMNTMIQGGHDTSLVPLSMALREMALNTSIQDKIYAEIVDVIGPDIDAEITLRHIDRMPYLHAVVKEALRRFFSLPFLDRLTLYDMVVDGTKIPKGTVVMFDFVGIMTDEQNYDDPLVFRPERFLKENVSSKSHRAFISFGYGAKACVGKNVAYAAMKLFLVKIIREFEVLHVDHDVQMKAEVFFRSVSGIPTIFKKRVIK